MKKLIMVAALSAIVMSASAVSITPTNVKISGSENALYPHYEVSGASSECGGLLVTIYDAGRTTKIAEFIYPMPELVTSGSHSVGLFLDGTGLNADDVEDGKPSVFIEMSVVDTCMATETGYQVLASGGTEYPEAKGSSGRGSSGGGGTTTRHYKAAQTLYGVVWTADGVAVLSIKTGKVSNKGVVSVSGFVMGMDGKKLTVKSAKLPVDGDERLHGTLQVKDGSTIDITIDEDEMWGKWKGMSFNSGDNYVGGALDNGRELVFRFANGIVSDILPDGTIANLLPEGMRIAVNGGKFVLDKSPTVKWVKDRATNVSGLVIDDGNGTKTNYSGLKLTYTPKTGTFKGSFKIYAVQNDKLKKYSAKVSGIVVNGTGFGLATIKGKGSVPIEID